jgi:hypothetical protein
MNLQSRHQYLNIPALIAGGNDTLTDVGEPFVLDGLYEDIVFDVVNTGTNLTKFALLVKAHSSGSWQNYLQTTGWDTVAGTLKKFIGTLKTLATTASGFAHVNVGPVYAVKFQASIASGARNAGTLTLVTDVPIAAETVTIGAKVYTWRAAPTTVANEVKIGASLAVSCDNLVAAINAGAGAGSLYGSATVAHTQVTAARSGDTVVVTAVDTIPNSVGTLIATTETMTNGSWGATTLADGVTTDVTIYAQAR